MAKPNNEFYLLFIPKVVHIEVFPKNFATSSGWLKVRFAKLKGPKLGTKIESVHWKKLLSLLSMYFNRMKALA